VTEFRSFQPRSSTSCRSQPEISVGRSAPARALGNWTTAWRSGVISAGSPADPATSVASCAGSMNTCAGRHCWRNRRWPRSENQTFENDYHQPKEKGDSHAPA